MAVAQQNEIVEMIRTLPPEQATAVFESYQKMLSGIVEQLAPVAQNEFSRRVGYSDEAAGLVHLLAAKSNDAKEEVLLKALTLYGLALDAREKGNRLAILNPDDEIVHDVIGFESVKH